MQSPSQPANETQRLDALKNTQLLDTQQEAVFDNLTQLVSEVFDVPYVAISLVDSDRQWFKSIHGLDVEETDRDISFCGHVVFEKSTLIVDDASKDKRFADNPLVLNEPNIHFYAGVPLRFAHQDSVFVIGTLCIFDTESRSLKKEQISMLKNFAYQVEALIDLRASLVNTSCFISD